MLKRFAVILLLSVGASNPSQLFSQTAVCGGSGGSAFILPSTPNVNALVIYTYFPSGNLPGVDDNIPSFASAAAQHVKNYYEEMSYNTHHVNIQVIQRPAPNLGKAFLANNSVNYYRGSASSPGVTELNTEILNKAYQENNGVFNGISVVFMFYGGDVFNGGTGVAQLNETSPNYSGCGAILEWGGFGSAEENVHKWNMAHEYGHLLSPDGTQARRLFDQNTDQPSGIYNIMHNVYFNGTQPMAAFNLIYLGWIQSPWIKEIDPTQSGNQSQTVTIKNTRLAPSSGNYNVVRIKIPGGAANEHFIVESRQGTGSDAYLSSGGKGLIIWHLNKSYGTYNLIGLMDVEIATASGANGQDWLDNGVGSGESRGFITDFFQATNKPNFAPWTNPSTETGYKYSSSTHLFTDLGILNISAPGSSMTFSFAENAPPGPPQNLVITNPGANGSHPILQWNANTEPDLDHYLVWRGTTPNWKTTPVTWETSPTASVTSTTWTDMATIINLSTLNATYYRLTAVDNAGNQSNYSSSVSTTSTSFKEGGENEEPTNSLPKTIALHQNYPNPFNPTTEIRYDLPNPGEVTLTIYNLVGQKIRDLVTGPQAPGYYITLWDGKDEFENEVASGVYVYRIYVRPSAISSQAFESVKKMTLLR